MGIPFLGPNGPGPVAEGLTATQRLSAQHQAHPAHVAVTSSGQVPCTTGDTATPDVSGTLRGYSKEMHHTGRTGPTLCGLACGPSPTQPQPQPTLAPSPPPGGIERNIRWSAESGWWTCHLCSGSQSALSRGTLLSPGCAT